ncbi:hypothetical protein ABQE01_12790 [Enterococcus thailandicus]|uniref:hypothetical protein n=1 Tax=Enterococcus thailandicus TaxID=417368 RepID=UPI0032E51C2C
MLSKTVEKITKRKINAIETALENNDYTFLEKWHGGRDFAIRDLQKLKQRLIEDKGTVSKKEMVVVSAKTVHTTLGGIFQFGNNHILKEAHDG